MDSKLYSKCEILFEVYMLCKDDYRWDRFFEIYDVGVPIARFVVMDWVEPTAKGIETIEEAFDDLCKIVGVDPEGDYESFDDMIQIGAIADES